MSSERIAEIENELDLFFGLPLSSFILRVEEPLESRDGGLDIAIFWRGILVIILDLNVASLYVKFALKHYTTVLLNGTKFISNSLLMKL